MKNYFASHYRPKIQRPLHLIMIATEGSVTEQMYFPQVASFNVQNVAVEMISDYTTNSDPVHVVERMRKAIRDKHFSKTDVWEAWVVIDDEWDKSKLDKVQSWAASDSEHQHYTVCNGKFEDWLKLHVDNDREAQKRYEALLSHRHHSQQIPEGFVTKARVEHAIAISRKSAAKPVKKKNADNITGEEIYILVEKIIGTEQP